MNTVEYMAQWHQRNKDRRIPLIKERDQRHKAAMSQWIRELKESTPCTDCGIRYAYYVMQFDHLRDKIDVIARIIQRGWSQPRIQSEIDKCEIVCANCHAVRTHQRKTKEGT